MKANEYKVLCDAIERGIDYGWRRAYKHDDNPTAATIKQHIEDALLNEICEYFIFEDNAESKEVW